jgi:hypothetical protein
MKKDKTIFWITTSIIFLFEGLMPALTSHTQVAVEGTRHLGYPDYFRILLTVFKVAGALVLILPVFPARIKEWAYAGFGFSLIAAFVSNWAVDGFSGVTVFPLVVLAILSVSYSYFHKLNRMTAA